MNIGIILSAGDSKRFGGYMHKQYLKINGTEMVAYTIKAMKASKLIDEVIIVVDEEEYESKYIANKYNVKCILGGKTRNESVYNALQFVKDNYQCDKIIFHDSVRPLITTQKLNKCLSNLDEYDAVVTVGTITDALVDKEFGHIKRSNFMTVQTPEAFRFEVLSGYNPNSKDLAIVSQINSDKILQLSTDVFNMKITYPEELFIAEQLMRLNYYSVKHTDQFEIEGHPQKVLLLGASGGIGQAIKSYLLDNNIMCMCPSHRELDLKKLTVDNLQSYLGDFVPDAIINAAATYYDDSLTLSTTFDDIFAVNVKANEILIEYSLTVNKKINIVLLSSSSSTKGRVNLTNYSAAKAALNSIVESQADKLQQKEIYLNAIIPEKVNTPLIEKLHKTNINLRELLEPQDVVNAIMYFATAREYGQLVHIRKGL